MANGTIMPAPWFTGMDDSGRVITGGKLYTYAAGTSSPLATFADVDLSVANPNPIILDGGGRGVAFLQPLSYKFVLKDANDVTIKSQDNISANASFNVDLDIAGVAGENIPAGSVVYLSVGLGGKTAGHWYLADADFDFASSAADFLAMVQNPVLAGAVGSFRLQGRTNIPGPPLTVGATYFVSTVAGGIVTPAPVSPAFTRLIGIADSQTTLVSATGLGTNTVLSGNASVTGSLTVSGTTTINGPLNVNGVTSFGTQISFTTTAVDPGFRMSTPDGADNQVLFLTGGGAIISPIRGGSMYLSGNEHPTGLGSVVIRAGDVPTGGSVEFWTGSFAPARMKVHYSGGVSIGTDSASGSQPGILLVSLTDASGGSDFVRIMESGNIWVGGSGTGGHTSMSFFNLNGQVGSISTAGFGTAYNTTSDVRLKTDLGIPLETRVLPRLIVHDFQWKDDHTLGRGLFAQEAIEVLPIAVTIGCEGPVVDEPWQVDYSKVVPDLIVGWQQHEARIISLLERLEALESRHDGKTS